MNSYRTFLILSSLFLTFAPHPVFAVGNVLLPDDNSGASGTPTSTGSDSVLDPLLPTTSDPTSPSPPLYSPVSPTISPAPMPNVAPTNPINGGSVSEVNGVIQMTLPTSIFPMPAPVPQPPPAPASTTVNSSPPPHTLTTSLSSTSLFSNDVMLVHNKLGYDNTSIPSVCVAGGGGMAITDGGVVQIDTGETGQSVNWYTGSVKTVMIAITARCTIQQLGPNQGIVKQMGNYYIVDIGHAFCSLPSTVTTPSTIVINRTADNPMAGCTIR